MSVTPEQRAEWREEAAYNVDYWGEYHPARKAGVKVLALLDALDEADEKCAAWKREHQYVCDERDRLRNAALDMPSATEATR